MFTNQRAYLEISYWTAGGRRGWWFFMGRIYAINGIFTMASGSRETGFRNISMRKPIGIKKITRF
jgi:hypothetical protein